MARKCAGCPLEHVEVDTLCETYCDDMKEFETVVHGHWISEFPNMRTGKAYSHTCSECGRTIYDIRQVSIDEMGYYKNI